MRNNCVRSLILPLLLPLVLGGAAGCSSHMNYRQAEIATQEGRWDDAVLEYLKALDEDPENITYRAALLRAKIKASQVHFEKGQDYRKAGVLERALVEFQQAVQLDTTNQYAQAELESTHRAYLAAKQNRDNATIGEMKEKSKGSRPQPPVLNPRSKEPISLDFPQDVSIFELYKALGQAFGINVMFDSNLKDSNISISLKDVDAQKALEIVMRSAGHFYKVLDEQTILIAAETPQNRRTYEDQVIQTFFLSNAEVKDMLTILRSLVDAKKIATNEQLNAIIMKDSTDKVKVAEKIIASNDKSKAEVVVDVELLQINSGRLRNLGFSLSSYSIGQSLDFGGSGGTGGGTDGGSSPTSTPVRLSDLQFINQGNWILTIPNFIYNFIKTNSNAQLLAKPQLRITDGEKANLVIGDRVPIPLTTFNTQNVGGQGGIVPITSFQYQDVGIRIDMEPRVHHNQEVTLKVKVEVSNLGRPITAGGQEQPTIGTRTIDSTIRLKDGETNFMAGLIRTDETASDTGIPGLSEIPVLGRLFSNKNTDNQRTDVILTLTPHIIRNAEITEEDLLPIWVGTEANFSFRGGSPRIESDVEGPFDGTEGTPEEIQDAIRRRIQRLPRGLRPGEVGGEEVGGDEETAPADPQPPRGIDLVPSKPPTDIFKPTDPPDSLNPNDPAFPQGQQPVPLGGRAAALGSEAPLVTRSVALATNAVIGDGSIQLRLAPRQLVVAPGDRFEVRVEVSALAAISHLPFALAFDPAVLAVEKIDAGDFLGTPGSGTSEVLSDASHAGEVVVGASRLGKVPGVAGQGLVARVTFRALAAGSTAVAIRGAKALGPQLDPLGPVATEAAQVQVLQLAPPRKPGKPAKPEVNPREAPPVQRG